LTVGILLREGFEAVLILIALLAVIRASDSKDAARWVHAGWASALGVGVAAWFFSGWLMAISGAQREMLEGVTALLAVAVLLYVGFWLHSRTEITRWTQFIDVQVKSMLSGRNLWGLAAIAFMAVFREAFETVLFMRALTLEGGQTGVNAMLLGATLAIGGLAALSWLLLKYSARLPIRTIFTVSSALMVILAVILTGKGLHALQETGALSVSATPWRWSTDVFGVYASWQPLIGQVAIAAIVGLLWRIGSRPTSHAN
jgi:high-affinity iron transporter